MDFWNTTVIIIQIRVKEKYHIHIVAIMLKDKIVLLVDAVGDRRISCYKCTRVTVKK